VADAAISAWGLEG